MEENIVKLISITIEKLYGCYNYNVNFNSDVTFIFGMNGCGKTTILNITEAIITGQIYKLFDYDFNKIILKYANKNNMKELCKIVIVKKEDGFLVNFRNNDYHITNQTNMLKETMHNNSNIEKVKYYFYEYDFLLEIKKIFNYVYLPLNRSSVAYDIEDEDNLYTFQHARRMYDDSVNKDLAMVQVQRLIKESYNRINNNITHISDTFRNNILKSLLDVNEQYTNSDELLSEIFSQQDNIDSIKQTKSAYIKLLKELSLINKKEETHFEEFFDSIYKDIQMKEKGKIISATTLLKINEVLKIKKLVMLAEETEKQKSHIRKPIEKFINTMNDFINTTDDEKEIKINSMGRVYFTTRYNNEKISIQHLSSGEKQLITFFANLIFKVKSSTSGIFVVDEPELSLHLSWQKIFIDKVLEINKNIQLIFATHAPEIIGSRRNKMYRLERKYARED